MIKLSFSSSLDLKKFKQSISGRLRNVKRAIGQKLAEKTVEHVKNKIKSSELWHVVYRDTIASREHPNGEEWSVSYFEEPKMHKILFETALIHVIGEGKFAKILAEEDPWSMSKIPAIEGGYDADLLVIPTTADEVTKRESELNIAKVIGKLAEGEDGATIIEDEEAQFKGKTYIDFYGINADLEKMGQKHWGPTQGKLITAHQVWAKEAVLQVNSAMAGNPVESRTLLDSAGAAKLAKIYKKAAEIRLTS